MVDRLLFSLTERPTLNVSMLLLHEIIISYYYGVVLRFSYDITFIYLKNCKKRTNADKCFKTALSGNCTGTLNSKALDSYNWLTVSKREYCYKVKNKIVITQHSRYFLTKKINQPRKYRSRTIQLTSKKSGKTV